MSLSSYEIVQNTGLKETKNLTVAFLSAALLKTESLFSRVLVVPDLCHWF